MNSETKLGSTFPNLQFNIEEFASPFRYDRNSRNVDTLLFVRENISSKLISAPSVSDFERVYLLK